MKIRRKAISMGITSKTDDMVGKSLVYALQERLNRSNVFRYDTTSDNRFELSVVSVTDDSDPYNNSSSAIAVVLIYKSKGALDWYINHWALAVGQQKTDEVAAEVVAAVNDDLNKIREVLDKNTGSKVQ